jgi:hypothetical protein
VLCVQAAVEVRKQVNQLDNLTTSKAVDALLNAETVALFGNRQLEVRGTTGSAWSQPSAASSGTHAQPVSSVHGHSPGLQEWHHMRSLCRVRASVPFSPC